MFGENLLPGENLLFGEIPLRITTGSIQFWCQFKLTLGFRHVQILVTLECQISAGGGANKREGGGGGGVNKRGGGL